MRTPSTAVRGVFVIIIILGVVFISNIGIVQSGASELLLEETTPTPTVTATPNFPLYFPVIKNKYGFLYSSVVIANGQGFDNCKPLSVEGMQNWWDNSPYSTVNIYLGGISALCPFDELDINWYTQVAEQGWSFILTWAGLQAPIKDKSGEWKFDHPMSTDPGTAYLEGKLEALAAVETAENAGFKGQLVIYYDVESYSGADDETKAAVASFIQGWTEQLHDLGHIAGAYGAACTSYVVDWAFNDPPLDDVWVAQWNKEYAYDPAASVYNTTCLDGSGQPPIFWTNHQRLKQYTGPHNETYGGLTLKIDSDVLDGQVVALFGKPPEKNFQASNAAQAAPQSTIPAAAAIREVQLLSPSTGWVLRENQLLWTADGGNSWQDISPVSSAQYDILAVHFNKLDRGWIAIRKASGDGTLSFSIYRTPDAGETWVKSLHSELTPGETWELDSATFEFLDGEVGWLALKLHSGNNFSFGRLLATNDGGLTWVERELPLGEPVVFTDAQNGRTAGGPLDQVYFTEDGGQSWLLSENQSSADLKVLSSNDQLLQAGEIPPGAIFLDSYGNHFAWGIIQEGTCTGFKPRAGEEMPAGKKPLECETSYNLLKTTDGGLSWDEISLP